MRTNREGAGLPVRRGGPPFFDYKRRVKIKAPTCRGVSRVLGSGKMRKWIFLFMLLGFGNDMALNSAAADCHGAVPVCHTCTCVHLVNNPDSRLHQVIPSTPHVVRVDADLLDFLSDKSIFHPPKVSS